MCGAGIGHCHPIVTTQAERRQSCPGPTGPSALSPDASRTGPESRSCTRVFGCVHTAHTAPAFGVGVRGSRSRPTGTRTGASAATVKRRASRLRSCSAAPPASSPVTRVQSGGSPSSVERVDVIGSSFPLRRRTLARSRSAFQYLPRAPPCEPLVTWPFANALVIAPYATQSSSDWGRTPRLSQKPPRGASAPALLSPSPEEAMTGPYGWLSNLATTATDGRGAA